MPIPLYISENTPLVPPADLAGVFFQGLAANDRRRGLDQEKELTEKRMAAQQQESHLDRQERGQRGKESSEYNRGMLDLYRGDRSDAKAAKLREAEDKAMQEYIMADMKGDEAGKERARQKLKMLGASRNLPPAPAAAARPGAPAPGAQPINKRFEAAPLDLGGGPMPLKGLY
jgi:hypothetical protein